MSQNCTITWPVNNWHLDSKRQHRTAYASRAAKPAMVAKLRRLSQAGLIGMHWER